MSGNAFNDGFLQNTSHCTSPIGDRMKEQLSSGDALLVVDMQNDFLPGGSLAVPGSETILRPVNDAIQLFMNEGLPIIASRDYHPADHISFRPNGGEWPPHCVAGSPGAYFHPEMVLPESAIVISKGTSTDREAYSALDSTPLSAILQEKAITRLFVCGLATDYCVLASAKDLLASGYRVVLLTNAIRAVDIQPGDGDRAIQSLMAMGATTTTTTRTP